MYLTLTLFLVFILSWLQMVFPSSFSTGPLSSTSQPFETSRSSYSASNFPGNSAAAFVAVRVIILTFRCRADVSYITAFTHASSSGFVPLIWVHEYGISEMGGKAGQIMSVEGAFVALCKFRSVCLESTGLASLERTRCAYLQSISIIDNLDFECH